MIDNFHTIITNKLYRGAAPSKIDVVFLKYNFGINKIISLDKECGNHISEICKILNIEHIIIDLNENLKSLLYLFSFNFDDLFFNNTPIFIHCRYGRDRTGLISAIIKIKFLNWTPERALNEARKLGFGKSASAKMIHLYETIIKKFNQTKQDSNKVDDIVQNTRTKDDYSGSVIDSATMQSFAPFMDGSKQYPYSPQYNYQYQQYPTRENQEDITLEEAGIAPVNNAVPEVGIFESNEGIRGAGPLDNGGGFTTT